MTLPPRHRITTSESTGKAALLGLLQILCWLFLLGVAALIIALTVTGCATTWPTATQQAFFAELDGTPILIQPVTLPEIHRGTRVAFHRTPDGPLYIAAVRSVSRGTINVSLGKSLVTEPLVFAQVAGMYIDPADKASWPAGPTQATEEK